MAEIDVVKKSSKTWLWMLLAAMVLVALWFMMRSTNNEERLRSELQGGQPHAAALTSPDLSLAG